MEMRNLITIVDNNSVLLEKKDEEFSDWDAVVSGSTIGALLNIPGCVAIEDPGIQTGWMIASMTLGLALAAFARFSVLKRQSDNEKERLRQQSDNEKEQLRQQQERQKYLSSQVFQVYLNGQKSSSKLYDFEDAKNEIINLAAQVHDPNTYYTIYDSQKNKIVWRFKVGSCSKP